ncbi:type IV pilus assembly protein PilC [Legionella lansingensis]|uniref:Pilus assembly protein PilC n=2 Tax=Legionella lansingensis TaxID=45067 RepID=A0A0W0VJJ7_9GAMM|nr:pilus assembly protein PilC [Legionella lansingensis]SNV51102.1 type IV pilus assembly protein PilC [Legionella lansingensis]
MQHYHWQGLNQRGITCKGIIKASTLLEAKFEVIQQGIILKKISKKQFSLFQQRSKKINHWDISVFSRQIATLIQAGIPLITAFDIIKKGQAKYAMRDLIAKIQKEIASGLTLFESLNKHPIYFNPLYCSLIEAGEKSGTLALMINNIASYREKLERMKRKITKTLAYPLVILIIALLITFALLFFVIPEFAAMFNAYNAELPFITQQAIHLSNFCQDHYFIFCVMSVITTLTLIYMPKYSSYFSQLLDRTLLNFPLIGAIISKSVFARFSRTLSITLAAGLPLVQALRLAANVTGNSVYQRASHKIIDEVICGQPMWVAIETTGLFPDMVVQMIAIGEESGVLEQMFHKIADYFEEDIDHSIDTLNTLLEPVIMSVLGLIIGFLLLAMYIPIFKLGSIT